MFPTRKVACLFWLAVPLYSQSLKVEADPVARGHEGSAIIRLDSPSGKEPLALQWEIHLPVFIQVDPRKVIAGEAATGAGKSVTCAMLVNSTGKEARCRCILSGGVKPIGNGPVALLKYTLAGGARPGRYQLDLKNVLGVGEGTKAIRIKDADAGIVVSP